MALRLRRGTDAERLLITPAQGELIYTTDTRKLYIGDGTTVGGRIVEGSGSPDLANLADVDVAGVLDGQLLAYNSATQKWEAVNASTSVGDGVVEGSNYRINVVGFDSTVMVDTDALTINAPIINGNVYGTLTGDITGSVFGDDSSLMIDGNNNNIIGRIRSREGVEVTTYLNNTGFKQTGLAEPGAIGPAIVSNSSNGSVTAPTALVGGTTGDGILDLRAAGYDGTDYTTSGIIRVAVDLDSTVAPGIVPGRVMFVTAGSNGVLQNLLIFNSQGRLGLGTPRPSEKLHVANGNAKIDGFVQFGSLTTTERNELTAAAGMVIWNETTTQFEGFNGTNWINLVDGVISA
jgi:hypothetical protein